MYTIYSNTPIKMVLRIIIVITLILLTNWSSIIQAETDKEKADSLFAQGWSEYNNQNYSAAESLWYEAYILYGIQDLFERKADSSFNMGLCGIHQDDNIIAFLFFYQASLIYEELGLEDKASEAFYYTGDTSACSNAYEEALINYDKALTLYDKKGLLEKKANTLLKIGNVYNELAMYDLSIINYNLAIELFTQLKLKEKEADAFIGLGSVSNSLRLFYKALEYNNKALVIYQDVKPSETRASALSNIGEIYYELAQYEKAISFFNQALAIYKLLNNEEKTADTYRSIGNVYYNCSQYEKALDNKCEAWFIYFNKKLESESRQMKLEIANILIKMKNYGKAKEYIDDKWGVEYKSAENILWEPIVTGYYYLNVDDLESAIEQFNILNNTQITNEAIKIACYIGSGLAKESSGEMKKSSDDFQKAISLIEKERENIPYDVRTNFLESINYTFRNLEAFEGLSRVLCRQNNPDESFFWSEHLKARMLLEGIARASDNIDFNIPESIKNRDFDLINRIASTRKRINEAVEKGNLQLRSQLEDELKKSKEEQAKLIETLRRDYPEYAAIQYPQPYKVNELALKPDEVLIEYEVTDPLTMIYVVKDKKVEKVVEVPLTREALEKMIKDYRSSFEDVGTLGDPSLLSKLDIELGHKLYELLLEKALAGVKPEEKVLIVPDEMLCLLPFEALIKELPIGNIRWKDDGQGPYPERVKFVGTERVFNYWQSASSMTVIRTLKKTVQGDKLLVVADPVYNSTDARLTNNKTNMVAKAEPGNEFQMQFRREVGDDVASFTGRKYFERLELTSDFAKDLEGLYSGQVSSLMGLDATEPKVTKQLENPYGRAVIFATHGIIDDRIPYYQQASIVLCDPIAMNEKEISETNDGFLTMTEIMNMKIPTEVVATFACQTGMGKIVGGEGVMHLGRAFQYAGARSVLISLWSVADKSTNILGERFFSGLKDGESKDAALLAARQELISKGYAHPFYWAPFILVGERD